MLEADRIALDEHGPSRILSSRPNILSSRPNILPSRPNILSSRPKRRDPGRWGGKRRSTPRQTAAPFSKDPVPHPRFFDRLRMTGPRILPGTLCASCPTPASAPPPRHSRLRAASLAALGRIDRAGAGLPGRSAYEAGVTLSSSPTRRSISLPTPCSRTASRIAARARVK